MYAVIFKAEFAKLDPEYSTTGEMLRELAITQYGCKEFISYTEGNHELAISYWESETQIKEWKQNLVHLEAQNKGRSKWYQSYRVQVVQVMREYRSREE